jgi:hypothetical protein
MTAILLEGLSSAFGRRGDEGRGVAVGWCSDWKNNDQRKVLANFVCSPPVASSFPSSTLTRSRLVVPQTRYRRDPSVSSFSENSRELTLSSNRRLRAATSARPSTARGCLEVSRGVRCSSSGERAGEGCRGVRASCSPILAERAVEEAETKRDEQVNGGRARSKRTSEASGVERERAAREGLRRQTEGL